MTRLNNNSGFSATEALLVLVIVSILCFTGWFVYHAKQTGDKNYPVTANSKASTYKAKKNASSTNTNESQTSSYVLSSVGASFLYPSNSVITTYPNGVGLNSPDFQSAGGFKKISSGSALVVSYSSDPIDSDTNTSLASQAESVANDPPTSSKFITVAGLNAIEFSYSTGENLNQHLDVLFIKDSKQYLIDQEFNLNAQNPYPDLVGSVVSSFKFNS